MKLGSLFDGIGGWPLAATRFGVEPVWASEIEKFPEAVTEYHFPDMKQLGDIRKINGAEVEPVDILCAGSPCQNLSVAGNMKGLQGSESCLFHEAVRILREMRKATNGKYPKYFVWENVPGAFSSNRGNDFRTVLSEIAETDIPMPNSGKWAKAGMVRSGGCEIGWRVLDAQYFGVPQRRKRIFLVASFGKGCAGKILFESEGLLGNTSAGREAEQGTSCGTAGGVGAAEPNLGRNHREIAVYDMTHADEVMRKVEGDKVNTLNARMGTGGNQVPVLHTYSLQGNMIGRAEKNGPQGCGINKDISFTLNATDRHAVFTEGGFYDYNKSEKAVTLRAVGGHLGGGSENLCLQNSIRKLTPTECEKLQGLPDGYTDISIDGKGSPDSQRYKALGNGMAQPCADFVIGSIVKNEKG